MTVDRMVLAFAGFVVLLGVALAQYGNPWWIGLSVFAGLNMIQAAFTGFCPVAMVFEKSSGSSLGSLSVEACARLS